MRKFTFDFDYAGNGCRLTVLEVEEQGNRPIVRMRFGDDEDARDETARAMCALLRDLGHEIEVDETLAEHLRPKKVSFEKP